MAAAHPVKTKLPKRLPLKNTGYSNFIFDVHLRRAYVNIYTKYEAPIFKLLDRAVHRQRQQRKGMVT